MHRLARTCLAVSCLVMMTAPLRLIYAEEAAHPEGRDPRRIEADEQKVEKRKADEKRDGTEASYKKVFEGKNFTEITRGEAPSPDELLKESLKKGKDLNSEPQLPKSDINGINRGLPPEGISPPVADPLLLEKRAASKQSEADKGGQSLWEPSGAEWRYSPEDKYHNPHWDYNRHDRRASPWQNIQIGELPPRKPTPAE